MAIQSNLAASLLGLGQPETGDLLDFQAAARRTSGPCTPNASATMHLYHVRCDAAPTDSSSQPFRRESNARELIELCLYKGARTTLSINPCWLDASERPAVGQRLRLSLH